MKELSLVHSIFYILTWSALLVSCSTPQSIIVESNEIPHAPAEVKIDPLLSGKWLINGIETLPQKGRLILTQSGNNIISHVRSMKDGMDTLSKTVSVLPPKSNCLVEIRTSKGTMVAELSKMAMVHADHFEEVIESGFYTDLAFHRVIPGFVIQGGDGKTAKGRPSVLPSGMRDDLDAEFNEELLHYKGALAMARMPDETNPEKQSSPDQFYIIHGRPLTKDRLHELSLNNIWDYKTYQVERYLKNGGAPQLDGNYTVFGYVILGDEVIDEITYGSTDEKDRPIEDIRMSLRMVR